MAETSTPRTPGWYPNPDDPATLRWWNGTNFDGDPRTVAPTATVQEDAPPEAAPKSERGFLWTSYILGALIPVYGAIVAIYVAVAESKAHIRRHAIGIGAVALISAGIYTVILTRSNSQKDSAVQADLSNLFLQHGTYATDVRCSHQNGNQYICFYKADGVQHTAQVTDDGHTISEIPY